MGNNEPAVDQSDFRIRDSYGLSQGRYPPMAHGSSVSKPIPTYFYGKGMEKVQA